MKFGDDWWTTPTESESGRTIIVTGRDNLQEAINSHKYIFRIEVSWKYDSRSDGMPSAMDSDILEKVTEAFRSRLKKDRSTIMTGIYTGDGQRDWIFYTSNLKVFNNIINSALSQLPTLPLLIEAFSDPDWEEYQEMAGKTRLETKG